MFQNFWTTTSEKPVIASTHCILQTIVGGLGLVNEALFEAITQFIIDVCILIVDAINSQMVDGAVHIKGVPLCNGTVRLQARHVCFKLL
jgi:hypothetical protein